MNENNANMTDYYLAHHGVKGQKWGVRRYQKKDGSLTMAGKVRNKYYDKRADIYEKRSDQYNAMADRLNERAFQKKHSMMNSDRRLMNYAIKEQRYAAAENFHKKKALGLSYVSKLTNSTLDYSYNKKRAERDAILKEKYSLAKSGVTNKVNRMEYRAQKLKTKGNKYHYKKVMMDAERELKGRDEVNHILETELGSVKLSKINVPNEPLTNDRTARTKKGRYGYANI